MPVLRSSEATTSAFTESLARNNDPVTVDGKMATPEPQQQAQTSTAVESWSSSVTTPGSTSATPPHTPIPAPASNGTKRPSRKSTLTQQQKNQKRQRASQDQLVTLELEFNRNPTPTAAVRERIAQEINMTERSVQIWFQNRWVVSRDGRGRGRRRHVRPLTVADRPDRRAKIKLLAKKSIETGEDCDAIPDSMRQYLAYQALESGKGLAGALPIRNGGAMAAYAAGDMLLAAEPNHPSKVGQCPPRIRSASPSRSSRRQRRPRPPLRTVGAPLTCPSPLQSSTTLPAAP